MECGNPKFGRVDLRGGALPSGVVRTEIVGAAHEANLTFYVDESGQLVIRDGDIDPQRE